MYKFYRNFSRVAFHWLSAFAKKQDEDKEIVSMIEYNGQILVALANGVYRIEGDKLVRLKFKESR